MMTSLPNLQQTVPFLSVSDMSRSLAYYVAGLGFTIQRQWVPEGEIRWVWLAREGAALMLQQFPPEGHDSWRPSCKVGEGVALYFLCADALAIHRELRTRAVKTSEPQVSNGMWELSLTDPDGYRLHFESPTETAEGTKLSDLPA